MSAGPVSVASDRDCMANTKENIFPVGLNKTLQEKSNVVVYQVVAKPPNVHVHVVVCLLILIQYVRQQMLV